MWVCVWVCVCVPISTYGIMETPTKPQKQRRWQTNIGYLVYIFLCSIEALLLALTQYYYYLRMRTATAAAARMWTNSSFQLCFDEQWKNEEEKRSKQTHTHTHKMLFMCVYLSHEYWINYVVLWHKARVNTDRYCSNIYWQFGQCFHYWTVTTETDGDAQLTLLVIVLRFAWFTGDKNAKTVRHCNIYDQIQIHSPFWKRVPGSLNPFVC